MGNRLTQIATRTGDAGTTGLGDNTRVSKDSLRVHAMGDVDELNSHIGVLLCEDLPADVRHLLVEIQHQLFNLGGELSIPGFELLKPEAVLALDEALATHNEALPRLQEFILPAGNRAASLAHVCRTVARRAERAVVALDKADTEGHTAPVPQPPERPDVRARAGAQPHERWRRRVLEERAHGPGGRVMRVIWFACGLAAWLAAPVWAQDKAAKKGKAPGSAEVTLVCEAVYLPARTTWTRTVAIGYDRKRVNAVLIDGVPVYTFAINGTTILTAIDNERIQIDTAAQSWTSDFRGQATSQGRCERH